MGAGGPQPVPAIDPGPAEPTTGDPTPGGRHRIVEWVAVLLVALVVAVGVRTDVAQLFSIPSGSMLPTLQIGDRILVDKLSIRLGGISRGDVVVFARPPLERQPYADLVKRVVGLPGETVGLADGRVTIDGRPLAEPWLPRPLPPTEPSPVPAPFGLVRPYRVPVGEYYVLGDNRTESEDSRYFGPIPASLVVGRVAFVAWPLSDTGWLLVLGAIAVVLVVLLVRVARAPRDGPLRSGGGDVSPGQE